MGQYYKGEKIGTCECMYYIRLDEAQALANRGEQDDDKISFTEYLNDNTTRWRFPFPNEEMDFNFNNREPFKTFALPCPVEVNHKEIVVSNQHFGGGYNVNIWLPCPHSKDFHLKTSNGGAGEQFICVEFEAIRNGEVKTIFKCARCGQSQRFSNDDIIKIKARAIEYFNLYEPRNEGRLGNRGLYDYAMEIIKRIR